jgi:hypothetical protein
VADCDRQRSGNGAMVDASLRTIDPLVSLSPLSEKRIPPQISVSPFRYFSLIMLARLRSTLSSASRCHSVLESRPMRRLTA